ncbi:MAG TPA: rod shape-determining protein MreC [Polyangiaceae bacterium]|nr:rod shape-determining protein MreC [Polyangiaceae bacterium]
MNSYRRYRDAVIVVLLLAVPFFVLRASIRDPRELNSVDRAVMRVSVPIQYVSSLIAREVSNLWGNYVYLVQVKADHQRLAYENARLEDRVRRLEQNEIELRRVKKLLGLRESVPGDLISAQVIGKDLTEFFRVASLVVDRAGREVRPNMPVIALGGVVGKVQRVAGDRVDVLLAVDSGSGIDVVDELTGARGFVRGTGDQSRYSCHVELMRSTDEVNVGDLLVTSGVGRAFPRGIPVARVTKVVKRDFGMYQVVEAVPTVDFSRLEEVLIITSPPSDEPGGPRPNR